MSRDWREAPRRQSSMDNFQQSLHRMHHWAKHDWDLPDYFEHQGFRPGDRYPLGAESPLSWRAACDFCKAAPGAPCLTSYGEITTTHKVRKDAHRRWVQHNVEAVEKPDWAVRLWMREAVEEAMRRIEETSYILVVHEDSLDSRSQHAYVLGATPEEVAEAMAAGQDRGYDQVARSRARRAS